MSFDDLFIPKNSGEDSPVTQVHNDLLKIIEKVKSLSPGLFLVVGHKSFHLYSEFSDSLSGSNFFVGFFQPLIGGGYIIQPSLPSDYRMKKLYAAVDSINTGKELETFLRIFPQTEKLFCYAANTHGIDILLKKKLISQDQIEAIYIRKNEEYQNFYRDTLQQYYQSIIDPMDTDHPHRTYIVTGINSDKLKDIVTECVNSILGKKKAEADEKVPKTLTAYSYDFLDCEGRIPDFLTKILTPIDIGLEYITVRVRTASRDGVNAFSLMVCSQPNVDMKTLIESGERICLRKTKFCYIGLCRFEDARSAPLTHNLICPLCISSHLSNIVLDLLQNALFDLQKQEGFEIKLKKGYLPLR